MLGQFCRQWQPWARRGRNRAASLVAGPLAGVAALTSPLPPGGGPLPSSGEISGAVSYEHGEAAAGVDIDVFTAHLSGARGQYLASVETGASGRYAIRVDDGCYVVVAVAPDGREFVGGGYFRQEAVCVTAGQPDRRVDAMLKAAVSTIRGDVVTATGQPANQVTVDLFDRAARGQRASFVTSTTTDAAGRFTLGIGDAGCYVLVLTAPPGSAFEGGAPQHQSGVCAAEGETASISAALASAEQAQIRGRVTFENDTGASGAQVDLYSTAGDGTRGAYLRSAVTDTGGWYSFDVSPACYVVVMTAPRGAVFGTGRDSYRHNTCSTGDDARATTIIHGLLAGSAHPPTELSAVELELVRLTNELRADPAGPLARQAPMPACVDDGFFALTLDPATGHPAPAPALAVDEAVSLELARAWAIEMQQVGDFSHRPGPLQQAIYDQLDISVTAWGENIAWSAGYSIEDTARIHFEGWRESDTGHYCSMLSTRFVYIGIGEHRAGDESWAVQNFYQPR